MVAVVLLTSCGGGKNEKGGGERKRPTPKVDGYIIKTEAFSETIEVPGSVLANEVTEIHPEVSGRVVRLNVREGQFVSRGTIIAKIYDGDLQAQIKKYQAQLGIARANEERASKLLAIQGISQQDYDATLLNVRNIQADIEIVRTEIARTEVRAPFSGKMGLKGISPGAYVTPATVIATINQVSTLKIDFSVILYFPVFSFSLFNKSHISAGADILTPSNWRDYPLFYLASPHSDPPTQIGLISVNF